MPKLITAITDKHLLPTPSLYFYPPTEYAVVLAQGQNSSSYINLS